MNDFQRQREIATMRTTRLMCLFLAVSCAAAPATPEQKRLAEGRLVEPYLGGAEVGCAELEIELTGNFHAHVGQPAIDPTFHKTVRNDGSGFREVTWTNLSGDPLHALRVTIGAPPELTEQGLVQKAGTTFRVVNQVRFRTWEDRRPLQLSATAKGFVFVREPRGTPREVAEYQVADGVMRIR